MRAPFIVAADGTVDVQIAAGGAAALQYIAREILDGLGEPGEDMVRLFPPAYAKDARAQEEFNALTRDDLVAAKRTAARNVIASIDERKARKGSWRGMLTLECAREWLGVINDARLVLGTRLDVTEEMDHRPRADDSPEAMTHNLYIYLGSLQEYLVEALAAREGFE